MDIYRPSPDEVCAARAIVTNAADLIAVYGREEATEDLITAWCVLKADRAARKAPVVRGDWPMGAA